MSVPHRARTAVAAAFFINGAIIGVWAANIPALKERLGLEPQILSYAFFAMAVGSITGMPLSGWLIARLGSARVMLISGMIFLVALTLPILAADFATLALSLTLFGMSSSVMDVAMNAHGVLVEARLPKPIMSFLHGMWSVGGLVGSALGGIALAYVGPRYLCLGAVVIGLGLFAIASRGFLSTDLDRQPSASPFAMPSRLTLGLGVLAFLGMMSEGAILDWSGIYLRELRASPEMAAAGFAGFSGTMAFGRFFGDNLRAQFGAARLVFASAALSLVGLALALLTPTPVLSAIGFALMGLGIANIAPVIYSAAGRLTETAAGASIASVIVMGVSGFLVGPPIIGFIAQHASLQLGLGGLAFACVAMMLLSPAAGR